MLQKLIMILGIFVSLAACVSEEEAAAPEPEPLAQPIEITRYQCLFVPDSFKITVIAMATSDGPKGIFDFDGAPSQPGFCHRVEGVYTCGTDDRRFEIRWLQESPDSEVSLIKKKVFGQPGPLTFKGTCQRMP